MKKACITLLSLVSIGLANEKANLVLQEIAQKKAQLAALQKSIKELENSLVTDEQRRLKANELKTRTELGYSKTDGNSDTTTFNLDMRIKKAFDKHKLKFLLDAQYAQDRNIESKNKYLTELSYDYAINKTFAFNYLSGYKQDKFSGFNYQLYTGPGANYKAVSNDKHALNFEANVLYSQDKEEDVKYDALGNTIAYPNPNNVAVTRIVSGKKSDYTSLRAKADYEWKVFETLTFTQEASYRANASEMKNYFIFSKTGITSKINSILSFGLSYKLDYVNIPVGNNERTDTTLSATLIVDY